MTKLINTPDRPHDRPAGGAPPEAMRVRMGASTATHAATLAVLAQDPALTVRAAVALNPAAPPAAQALLAEDEDDRIRTLLAQRLASFVPGADPGALQERAMRLLAALAQDQATRVRAAIADILKEMPDAPRSVILTLAHDAELSVAGPVLRLSPLLTSQDLLALLSAGDAPPGALQCVAARPKLPAELADAIAATADTAAVTALLWNESAQIRESTLDALVMQAAGQPDWHEPLAHRPQLSDGSIRQLAEILAEEWLTVLAGRDDLPPNVLEVLRRRLPAQMSRAVQRPAPAPTAADDMGAAIVLRNRGALDEHTLLEAVRDGRKQWTCALLAVSAEMPYAAVERAVAMRNAKGLVSLVWKAGMTMRAGTALQVLLAELDPEARLYATRDGLPPLTVEEMRWQLEFLARRQ